MNLSRKIVFLFLLVFVFCHADAVSQKNFTVVIDPGHGGRDPGALGARSKEKDLNLSVALKLGKLIENNHSDVNVIYTRKTDVFIELSDRAKVANKNHADLFISIHANSAKSKSAYGTETFTFGLSKSQSNLDVAMRENAVITLEDDYQTKYEGFDPKSVESYIMFEFMQDKYMDRSIEFASFVQQQFVKDCKRHDRGVRQGELIVLHRSACPSALIELGFISNDEEERYMMSDKGQKELSEAIYQAFSRYKRDHDKKTATAIVASTSTNTNTATNTTAESSSNTKDVKPVFKVQLFIAREALKANSPKFKGIKNTEYYKEGEWYKYTTGSTSDYDKIQKTKQDVQSKFPDAFVIAFLGDKKISVDEANKLLKEK